MCARLRAAGDSLAHTHVLLLVLLASQDGHSTWRRGAHDEDAGGGSSRVTPKHSIGAVSALVVESQAGAVFVARERSATVSALSIKTVYALLRGVSSQSYLSSHTHTFA